MLDQQVVALAGVTQAAVFVDWVANARDPQPQASQALLRPVLIQDVPDLRDLVPDLSRFEVGLETLSTMLTAPGTEVVQPARYLLNILEIARRLRGRPSLVERLRNEIAANANAFSGDETESRAAPERDAALAQLLADIYLNTVSKMPRRVQVVGVPERLQQPKVAAHIRALLLSGVRFAWLWHQLGGRRWHLVTRRRAMRNQVAHFLDG